jgi:hypothetical protein
MNVECFAMAVHSVGQRLQGEDLGEAAATVYALCEEGKLAHVSVSNALRSAAEDVELFLQARRAWRT